MQRPSFPPLLSPRQTLGRAAVLERGEPRQLTGSYLATLALAFLLMLPARALGLVGAMDLGAAAQLEIYALLLSWFLLVRIERYRAAGALLALAPLTLLTHGWPWLFWAGLPGLAFSSWVQRAAAKRGRIKPLPAATADRQPSRPLLTHGRAWLLGGLPGLALSLVVQHATGRRKHARADSSSADAQPLLFPQPAPFAELPTTGERPTQASEPIRCSDCGKLDDGEGRWQGSHTEDGLLFVCPECAATSTGR